MGVNKNLSGSIAERLQEAEEQTQAKKQDLAGSIAERLLICQKEVLTSREVSVYTGMSQSYIYKLTMKNEIPHYKPMGKMCYFNRKEIENWLQQNKIATSTEIADRVDRYLERRG